jgi:hypothetical protein
VRDCARTVATGMVANSPRLNKGYRCDFSKVSIYMGRITSTSVSTSNMVLIDVVTFTFISGLKH